MAGNNSARDSSQLSLECVLGSSVTHQPGLCVNKVSGSVAYAAGCCVVLYDPASGKQTTITPPTPAVGKEGGATDSHPISCVRFSDCGRLLAVGERGRRPAVRVYSVASGNPLARLPGHEHGIACLAFAPDGKHLVSVGFEHDRCISYWAWKSGTMLASGKVSTRVHAVAFSPGGDYFVTAGNRHIKFWTAPSPGPDTQAKKPLEGRAAVLGVHRNARFFDAVCGTGRSSQYAYAASSSGAVLRFCRRKLDKTEQVAPKGTPVRCMWPSDRAIVCGTADGQLLSVNQSTMQVSSPAAAATPATPSPPCDAAAPYVALGVDRAGHLTTLSADGALRWWQPSSCGFAVNRELAFHSSSIWSVDTYTPDDGPTTGEKKLEPNTFATGSADGTVRFWKLHAPIDEPGYTFNGTECQRILRLDEDGAAATAKRLDRETPPVQHSGIRCIKFSPDGQHLAAGDSLGNIRLFETDQLEELSTVQAHEAEILAIDFTHPLCGHSLVASGSRDRLIHVFDVENDLTLVQTLDEHSAATTAVKFAANLTSGNLKLLSCGADKAVYFREAVAGAHGQPAVSFKTYSQVQSNHSIHDLTWTAASKFAATVGQDRSLHVYDIQTGEAVHQFKTTAGNQGSAMRLELDPSGMFVASGATDKRLRLHDFYSGECVGTVASPAEAITGLQFHGQRVISTSADGCVYVWRLGQQTWQTMHRRLAEIGSLQDQSADAPSTTTPAVAEEVTPATASGVPTPRIAHDLDSLPSWARKHVLAERAGAKPFLYPQPTGAGSSGGDPPKPKGKWGQRVPETFTLFSELGSTGPVVAPLADVSAERRRYTIEPSASVESSTSGNPLEDTFEVEVTGVVSTAADETFSPGSSFEFQLFGDAPDAAPDSCRMSLSTTFLLGQSGARPPKAAHPQIQIKTKSMEIKARQEHKAMEVARTRERLQKLGFGGSGRPQQLHAPPSPATPALVRQPKVLNTPPCMATPQAATQVEGAGDIVVLASGPHPSLPLDSAPVEKSPLGQEASATTASALVANASNVAVSGSPGTANAGAPDASSGLATTPRIVNPSLASASTVAAAGTPLRASVCAAVGTDALHSVSTIKITTAGTPERPGTADTMADVMSAEPVPQAAKGPLVDVSNMAVAGTPKSAARTPAGARQHQLLSLPGMASPTCHTPTSPRTPAAAHGPLNAETYYTVVNDLHAAFSVALETLQHTHERLEQHPGDETAAVGARAIHRALNAMGDKIQRVTELRQPALTPQRPRAAPAPAVDADKLLRDFSEKLLVMVRDGLRA